MIAPSGFILGRGPPDDESLCRSFGRLLRTAGFQTVTYGSAEAFLEDNKRPRFDCLVLDIELAGLSGIELQQQLASGGGSVPTIFITGNDDPVIRERAENLGCVGYLRKTASGSELLNLIRSVLSNNGEPE